MDQDAVPFLCGLMRVQPPETRDRRLRGEALAAYEIDWRDPENIDQDDLVAFVHGQYEAGKLRRLGWEAQAAEQLAWARGNQQMVWDHGARDLRQMAVPEESPLEYRDPIHVNRLKGMVLSYLGMTVGQAITWICHPGTRDDDDVASSRTLAKLLPYYWAQGLNGENLLKVLNGLWHVFCTGLVFTHPIWDPQAGARDRFTAEGLKTGESPESEAQRAKSRKRFAELLGRYRRKANPDGSVDLPQGDLELDWATGFDITEPEHAIDLASSDWLLDSRYRTIEWVRERYPGVGEDVTPDAGSDGYDYRGYERFGGYDAYTGKDGLPYPGEEVLVHSLWRPRTGPQGAAPYGFYGVVADMKVLHVGAHPYMHGRLPYIRMTEMPDPDQFRPGCSIRDLMPLQRAMNKERSQLHGHLSITMNPRIFKEQGSGIPDDAFTGNAKVVEVGQDTVREGRARAFEFPKVPPYAFALQEQLRLDLEDVGGIHRSTTGTSESAQQSGRHAQLMQQGDQRRLSIVRQLLETAMAATGQQMAWLIWEFMTTERAVTVTGPDRRAEVIKFKGRGLAKNKPFGPHAFNVQVEIGTEPDMRAVLGKMQLMQQGGWLRPERESDRQMVMRWLGEQRPPETDEHAEHRANAAEENDSIADGQRVAPAYGDDDVTHMEEHAHFTTTAEYRQALKNNDSVRVLMELHIRAHMFQRADKEFRPVAIAKRIQADLVAEYGLVAQRAVPAAAGPAGGPGPAPSVGPPGGGGRPGVVPRNGTTQPRQTVIQPGGPGAGRF